MKENKDLENELLTTISNQVKQAMLVTGGDKVMKEFCELVFGPSSEQATIDVKAKLEIDGPREEELKDVGETLIKIGNSSGVFQFPIMYYSYIVIKKQRVKKGPGKYRHIGISIPSKNVE